MNIHNSIKKIIARKDLERKKYERIKRIVILLSVLFIGIFIGNIFLENNFSITGLVTGNLPDVGDSNWGTILNNYLLQEHTTTGAHGDITSNNWTNVSITESQISDLQSYRTLNNLTFVGNANVTGNLTLGDKITFAFGEVIDNLVSGFIKITGNLNVTNNAIINGNLTVDTNTLFVDSNTNKVGIGTTSPTDELNVVGNVNITGNITTEGLTFGNEIMLVYDESTHTTTGWVASYGNQDFKLVQIGALVTLTATSTSTSAATSGTSTVFIPSAMRPPVQTHFYFSTVSNRVQNWAVRINTDGSINAMSDDNSGGLISAALPPFGVSWIV